MSSDSLAVVIVAIAMAVGLVGVLLPLLPGLWLIWVAGIVYGLMTDFGVEGWIALAVMTLIGGAGTAAGVVVPQRQTAEVGIPVWGQLLAAAAAVVGMFVVPVLGAPIGFVLAVLAVQVIRTWSLRDAPIAAWVAIRSMAIASGLQFLAGLSMVVTWVVWVLVG